MAFRFRRSASFLGGLFKLNLSKGGLSITAGIPGAHVNIAKSGIVATASAPGTGMSYRQRIARFTSKRPINVGDE